MSRVHCAVLNPQTPTPTRGVCDGLTGSQRYGGHGERETPGHIPNPEAKPLSADGTALETGWESRTPPDITSRKGPSHQAGALSHTRTRMLYRDQAPALDRDKARAVRGRCGAGRSR